MQRVTILLRTLVIVGAVLLVVSMPRRGEGGEPGDCQQAYNPQITCPSGCSESTGMQVEGQLNGTIYIATNSNKYVNCGTALPGQQCNPPLLNYQVPDFEDCCTSLGSSGCTGDYNDQEYMSCCDEDAQCTAGTCCYEDDHDCSHDTDCCSNFCDEIFYVCDEPGGGGGGGNCQPDGGTCQNNSDCCLLDCDPILLICGNSE
jgi:hypothetical protein